MVKRKNNSLMRRQARNGYLFLIPLLIGLVTFFIIPIITSFLFSIFNLGMGENGYKFVSFAGIEYYINAVTDDVDYLPAVTRSIGDMALQAPLIIIFSFFMASILNQDFKGRIVFRIIMFLPIIIVSSAITFNDANDILQNSMNGFSSYKSSFGGTMTSFSGQFVQYMYTLGLEEHLIEFVQYVIDGIYNVVELSAIQILILLTGMQSISPSLYEAAKVEGGTAWENFWKITFPMVSPLILTCVVYTIIDSFTTTGNTVMDMIEKHAFTNGDFSLSSSMAWLYFIVIILILGIVSFIISKFIFYYDD